MRSGPLAVARITAALVVGVALLGLSGCGTAVRTLSFPIPEAVATTTASTTPDTLADPSGLGEPVAPGVLAVPPVVLGPGDTTLDGEVVGPSGGVTGATVQIERLVGERSVTTSVVSGAGGAWRLAGVLGGRYRVRAWKAPALAMTTAHVFYVADGASLSLALRPRSFVGPTVTSSFAPDPATTGRPTTVDVDVTHAVVSATGIVGYQPVAGRDVELLDAGEWTVTGRARVVTAGDGGASFVASCGAVGTDPLTIVVEQRFAIALDVPACVAAPTAPTVTTTSTTTTATTTPAPTTTAPGRHGHHETGTPTTAPPPVGGLRNDPR